ncbi:MAG: CehA/McbA family metallohydrolase, partial [Vicinamibacterales bacterium]
MLATGTLVLLPPTAASAVPATFHYTWPVARGAFHVHSNRSDGTGTLDEIAAAARATGLHFVVVTDHGNGTREPEPPAYRSGVLCIDGVEISTQHGHYIALGVGRAPYPLAGHPKDVIDDVRRLGGFGIAAHPGSPKDALRWGDWDAPFDGLEWLNADSEWRDEFWGSLGGVLLTYAFRPVETLAGLLDRPETVLRQWDRVTRLRRVSAIAGADAHARLGFARGGDPYDDRIMAEVPAYEVSFRAFANHVLLERALNGNAARDASLVLSAIREGRTFTSIDGLAGLSAFEAKATSGAAVAPIGEYLDPEGPVVLDARIGAPPGTTLIVRRDGEVLY